MYGRRAPLRGREPSLPAARQGVADARGVGASGLMPITVRGRVAVATRADPPICAVARLSKDSRGIGQVEHSVTPAPAGARRHFPAASGLAACGPICRSSLSWGAATRSSPPRSGYVAVLGIDLPGIGGLTAARPLC